MQVSGQLHATASLSPLLMSVREGRFQSLSGRFKELFQLPEAEAQFLGCPNLSIVTILTEILRLNLRLAGFYLISPLFVAFYVNQ